VKRRQLSGSTKATRLPFKRTTKGENTHIYGKREKKS